MNSTTSSSLVLPGCTWSGSRGIRETVGPFGVTKRTTKQPEVANIRAMGVGPIDFPRLRPHARVGPEAAEVLGRELRERYEHGQGIPQIAEDTGYSISRIRHPLACAVAILRPRGRLRSEQDDDGGLTLYAHRTRLED